MSDNISDSSSSPSSSFTSSRLNCRQGNQLAAAPAAVAAAVAPLDTSRAAPSMCGVTLSIRTFTSRKSWGTLGVVQVLVLTPTGLTAVSGGGVPLQAPYPLARSRAPTRSWRALVSTVMDPLRLAMSGSGVRGLILVRACNHCNKIKNSENPLMTTRHTVTSGIDICYPCILLVVGEKAHEP